tara:strand:+ start:75 stop:1679 length:1605 start_codon:yes stop_codon:yes gene_type:complete
MAVAQPFTVVPAGGLDLVSPPYELLRKPNLATKLNNFEVSNQGGYRRINGFTAFGAGSAVKPEGNKQILGVQPYGAGVVVCVDTSIYYSEDGITWVQVNKNLANGGNDSALAAASVLDRPAQTQASFKLMKAPTGKTTALYGSLIIATGTDKVALFRIEGTGGSKTWYYEEIATPSAGKYIEIHEQHLCIVDTNAEPSTVTYSTTNSDHHFTGSGAGSITVNDKIVGIKSFRSDLYIFCERSIKKLVNINITASIAVEDVTNDLGCVSGYTIQEIGGDLIYLSQDGFRTIAGTERIGDIELGTVSKNIQPLISSITNNPSSFIFNSVVIKGKDQYRLYYSVSGGTATLQKGIIGTLRANAETGALGFEWSTISGFDVSAIGSSLIDEELYYHGDLTGGIYTHDSGDTFSGTNIIYNYVTGDMDFGDPGMRKTLHYMILSTEPEGDTNIGLQTRFNFSSLDIVQPPKHPIGTLSYGAVYGTAVYGTSLYGTSSPLKRINLRGSGTSCSFQFTGEDANPPFKITGMYITFVPSDRR